MPKYDVVLILLVLAIIVLAGVRRPNPELTKQTLQSAGFSDVQVTGNGWYSCGRDFWSTEFRATNPKGGSVQGAVCCGLLFKSCTVRF